MMERGEGGRFMRDGGKNCGEIGGASGPPWVCLVDRGMAGFWWVLGWGKGLGLEAAATGGQWMGWCCGDFRGMMRACRMC